MSGLSSQQRAFLSHAVEGVRLSDREVRKNKKGTIAKKARYGKRPDEYHE